MSLNAREQASDAQAIEQVVSQVRAFLEQQAKKQGYAGMTIELTVKSGRLTDLVTRSSESFKYS